MIYLAIGQPSAYFVRHLGVGVVDFGDWEIAPKIRGKRVYLYATPACGSRRRMRSDAYEYVGRYLAEVNRTLQTETQEGYGAPPSVDDVYMPEGVFAVGTVRNVVNRLTRGSEAYACRESFWYQGNAIILEEVSPISRDDTFPNAVPGESWVQLKG